MLNKSRVSEKVILIIGIMLTAICVSLTYFYFEAAVRHSTSFIWDSLLNTPSRRLMVVPTCLVLSIIFFGVQHYFDKENERHETEGLGNAPKPTAKNFVKVIGIGFLSLLAGASLGPEAILLPASIVVGGYIGAALLKKESLTSALSMAGFIAIITAFFNSFWVGMLGLLLIRRQLKLKLNITVILIAIQASLVTVLTLSILSSKPYAKLPASNWNISLSNILILGLLLIAGFATTHLYSLVHMNLENLKKITWARGWLFHAIIAGVVLSVLYLLGGPLVEFTGNESVVPMLDKAASLGIFGLLWLFVIKVAAITWSKATGYRGGMVFPTIFVSSVLVAMAQQIDKSLSFNIGLLMVIAGVIIANKKLKILF